MKVVETLSRNAVIPRRVRRAIDENVAVQGLLPIVVPQLVEEMARLVDLHVNDASGNAAMKDALAIAIRQALNPKGNS